MKFSQYLALGSALLLCASASPEAPDVIIKRTTLPVHHSTVSKHPAIRSTFHNSAGNFTSFRPTSCIKTLPPANPTAHVTLNSGYATPITIAMYTPSAGAQSQLQLQANGTRILYNSNGSKGFVMMKDNGESMTLNEDGSFEYIAPSCAHGVTGTVAQTTAATQTNIAHTARAAQIKCDNSDHVGASLDTRVAPKGDGEPTIEIDLTLVNQCVQPATGQKPRLLCYQSIPNGAKPIQYNSPVSDFKEVGNGVYKGVCEIRVDIHNLCEVGEAVCSDLGKFIVSQGSEVVCGGVTTLLTEGNFIAGYFAAKLCEFAAQELLNKFCSAEGLDGDFSQCAPAQVTPVLSMNYLFNTNNIDSFTTARTLTTIGGQFSTTISASITSLATSCSVSGNPFPTPTASPDCAFGLFEASYFICANCYESGFPWEQGWQFDVLCNACCGCCYKTGTGPVTEQLGPQAVCCTQEEATKNPECDQNYCQIVENSGRYDYDCHIPTAEELCTNTAYSSSSSKILLECENAFPDFVSLFSPNSTYYAYGVHVCRVGLSWPPMPDVPDPFQRHLLQRHLLQITSGRLF